MISSEWVLDMFCGLLNNDSVSEHVTDGMLPSQVTDTCGNLECKKKVILSVFLTN
jgi:hypothetical protein